METKISKPAPRQCCTFNTGSAILQYPGLAHYAVNALAIANQSSWEEEFALLMEQVHRLSLMPNDMKCILAMLEARGYIRQPKPKDWYSVTDVVDYMNEHCTQGQRVIVKTNFFRGFYAIVPEQCAKFGPGFTDGRRYHFFGLDTLSGAQISDIWVRWADGQDHSPVKRRKGRKASPKTRTPPTDHECFRYLQKNPQTSTGDCVVRAVAALLDIGWDEAMDRLAAVHNGAVTAVNDDAVYPLLLEKEGFERRKPMQINGKLPTGQEFCRELDRKLRGGEKVFAYVGDHHVAAVLPFREENGIHYKIVDSWDCSKRKFGAYWVKAQPRSSCPPRPAGMPVNPDRLKPGQCILHPKFGRGKISRLQPAGLVVIDFQQDQRILASKWVLENCFMEAV